MAKALPISRLINVDVNLSPSAAQMQNISTLLILGTSTVIDVIERFRTYASIDAVASDFGTSAEEYLAALLWFEQAPQPNELLIGRWAKTATKGRLTGKTLSAAEQQLASWKAVTTPSFRVAIDGGAPSDIGVGSFATVTNLNGVAALIQTALNSFMTGSTCVWDGNYNRFVIESGTAGALSNVSFLVAPSTGTDISLMLGMRATSSGAYVSDGVAAETAVTAVSKFDADYGQRWYATTVLGSASNADHQAIAAYLEATDTKHLYGVSTQEAGVLVSGDTTNIAYLLSQAEYKRSVVQYSSSNPYSVCSLLGRILTVNYNGNNTVITLMYKQEPGIVPETLNSNQVTNLENFKCNVFVSYNNDTAIIEKGVVSSGDFLDIITGTDWLALQIQNEVFNLLYTSLTKIPQTDPGHHILVTAIEGVCSQAVRNGLLAPGTWTSGGFGILEQNDFLPKGFYVYAPPVAQQFAADRAARRSVPIQVAAKLAGAIHTVDITINVNR